MAVDPANLAITTPNLFFTRWITHFCAPIFDFQAGTSTFLITQKKSKKELSVFLIKRGCMAGDSASCHYHVKLDF